MKILPVLLSAALVGNAAFAGPMVKPGTCELVVASRSSLSKARSYVQSKVSNKAHTKIFKSTNGWYAVSIGALTPKEEEPIISRWKASGKIPQDAFCSTGKKFVGQYDWRNGTKTARKASSKKKKSSSASTGDIVAGAAALAILGLVLSGSSKSKSKSKSSSSSSSYTPKYGCEFVCEGQFGNARSSKFRVNTPHTNSADAQNYVRRQYEAACKKFPFYASGGGSASVGYPYCETYYYK